MGGRIQSSKRARAYRKQALWAGLPKNTAHPSHIKTKRVSRFIEDYQKQRLITGGKDRYASHGIDRSNQN